MGNQDKELSNCNCFGNYIKYQRRNQGLLLKDLSQKSNISITYLNRLENNIRKKPSLLILKKLAVGLEVPIMELLQISLASEKEKTMSIREILQEVNYTIKGITVSKEVRILLCEIVEHITSDELQQQDISNVRYQKLVELIKDFNKLL